MHFSTSANSVTYCELTIGFKSIKTGVLRLLFYIVIHNFDRRFFLGLNICFLAKITVL